MRKNPTLLIYQAPEMELLQITAEQGFVGSTNFEDPNYNDNYVGKDDFWQD